MQDGMITREQCDEIQGNILGDIKKAYWWQYNKTIKVMKSFSCDVLLTAAIVNKLHCQ